MNKIIKALFPRAKPMASRNGAERRLAQNVPLDVVQAVVQVGEREFLAVAFLGPHNEHLAGQLAIAGVCVTNCVAPAAPVAEPAPSLACETTADDVYPNRKEGRHYAGD